MCRQFINSALLVLSMGARHLIIISSLLLLLCCSSREPNLLGIREFNYSGLEPTYEVNSLLQLKINRKFQFHLYPKLRTHILSNGSIEEISLPEQSNVQIQGMWTGGSFDREKPERVLSVFESHAKVDKIGAIHFSAELGIAFSELEVASFRTRLFIQLKISHPDMRVIDPITVYGIFSFNPSQDTQHINFQEYSNEEFRNAYETKKQTTFEESPQKLFIDYWSKFGPIEIRDMQSEPTTQQICELLYSERQDCIKRPEQFFYVSRFKMMENVLQPFPKEYERIEHQLNISATFFRELILTEKQTESDRKSKEFSLGLFSKYGYDRFGTGPSMQLGYGLKAEKFYSTEASITDDLRTRTSVMENFLVRQEHLKIEIDAEAKNCYFVRPNLTISTLYKTPSVLYCAPKQNIKFRESWYHLHDIFQVNHSILMDYKDPKLNSFNKKIRGEAAYKNFRKEISDKTKAFKLVKLEPKNKYISEVMGNEKISGLFQDGGIFPGVIEYENIYSSKWNELQIIKLSEICSENVQKGNPDKAFSDKVCRCYYEGLSREVDFVAYSKDVEGWQIKMKESKLEDRCRLYAQSH